MVSISSHDAAIQTVLNAKLCRNKIGNPGRSDLPKYLDLALREAFRGGNTHASRFKAKKILRNVHSCDRSSELGNLIMDVRLRKREGFPNGVNIFP